MRILCLLAAAALSCAAPFTIDRSRQMTLSPEYLSLAEEYAAVHYGMKTAKLTAPQVVVIHATGCASLEQTIAIFERPVLTGRKDIERGGRWNVGVHFIVDKDGSIYSFIPLGFMARHAIGLNHTAVGIENVAENNSALTAEQLAANEQLIMYLKAKLPSITHLLGHHENNDRERSHYRLMRMNDAQYLPGGKDDPGERFMQLLRERLLSQGLVFLD